MTDRLLAALPTKDEAFPPGSFFKRCAIVGSSGILRAYDNGEEIDAHDLVFRFNRCAVSVAITGCDASWLLTCSDAPSCPPFCADSAPVKKFEKYAGAKTTHRLTNTRNFAYREYASEHVFVHLRNKVCALSTVPCPTSTFHRV